MGRLTNKDASDMALLAPMRQALKEAKASVLLTSPNPHVGCVLISTEGKLLGKGHTQKAGGPHAEIVALRDAVQKGNSVQGATAFVTLEPCSHYGRTGPCCEALAEAGIKRVVASIADPNPLVSGRGFEMLRATGIQVEVGMGSNESRELNLGFFSRMLRKTPWVRLKVAASLDGKTALDNGVSQWITSEYARTDGHKWRARACAVLTGIGTITADNPRMNVRLINAPRQPHLVVVDSQLEMPLNANIFLKGRSLYIYTAIQNISKKAALEAQGATIVYMPGANGKVDLSGMLNDLALREINELHVEAGQRLNGSFISGQLVDEFLIYLAPKLIGKGMEMANFGPLSNLSEAIDLEFLSTKNTGPDLRIQARVRGRDQF